MGLTNLTKVLAIALLIAFCIYDGIGVRLPFVVAGIGVGLLFMAAPFSALAEKALIDTSLENRMRRRLVLFAVGALSVFGAIASLVIDYKPL